MGLNASLVVMHFSIIVVYSVGKNAVSLLILDLFY